MTWNPKSEEEIISCGKHEYAEFPKDDAAIETKVKQVQRAVMRWDELADVNKNIEVLTYDWMPAYKCVLVENESALIEFMTYDSQTLYRPALLVRKNNHREERVFELFSEQLHAMLPPRSKRLDQREKRLWFRELV